MIYQQLQIRRFQDGRPVTEDLALCYDRDTGRLMIFAELRKRKSTWRLKTLYRLEEIETQIPGRGFLLHRITPLADPFNHARYSVLLELNGKARCDCPGWSAKAWIAQHCKHVEAMKWLNDNGHLDPEACRSCGATDCVLVEERCNECLATTYFGQSRQVFSVVEFDDSEQTGDGTCVICGRPASQTYPYESAEFDDTNSCGSMTCELQIQAAIDYHADAGDR